MIIQTEMNNFQNRNSRNSTNGNVMQLGINNKNFYFKLEVPQLETTKEGKLICQSQRQQQCNQLPVVTATIVHLSPPPSLAKDSAWCCYPSCPLFPQLLYCH